MKAGYVYIMASRTRTIYVGVTSDPEGRIWEHKHHVREGFTKQHNVTSLVYIAELPDMDQAIGWEKALKGKSRAKKIAIIEAENPRWNDLAWNWYEDAWDEIADQFEVRHTARPAASSPTVTQSAAKGPPAKPFRAAQKPRPSSECGSKLPSASRGDSSLRSVMTGFCGRRVEGRRETARPMAP